MSVGSLGAGSGLDLESLVKNMVSAQRDAKVKLYQDKINGFEAKLSALGTVGSAIDSFKASAQKLNNPDLFSGRNAKIDQPEGKESVAIETDNSATNGSFSVDVNQLAQGSRVMSAPGVFSSVDDVVSKTDGTLIFKAGDNEFSIDVVAGTTLSDLRKQINTSTDNFGVSANLVDDGRGNIFFTASSSIQGAGNTLEIINKSSSVTDESVVDDVEDSPVVEDQDIPEEVAEESEVEEPKTVEEEPIVDDSIDEEEPDKFDIEGDEFDYTNDGPIPVDEDTTDDIQEDSLGNDAEDVTSDDALAAEEMAKNEQAKSEEEKIAEESKVDELAADKVNNTDGSEVEISLATLSTTGPNAGLYVPMTQRARDAVITVDGIQILNDTNEFEDAVAGLTIEALAVSEKTAKIDITFDKDTVKDTLQDFISSYNELIDIFQRNTDKGSVLTGNSMIRNLESSLATQLMTGRSDTGAFSSIFDLGVKMGDDAKLSFNSTKFESAMQKGYSEVASLLSGENGLAQSLENLLDNYTGSNGMTSALKDSAQRSIDSTEETLEAYEDRMARYEESLRSKFTSLDSRLANMNAQGGYLNSVLAKM